jgi:hypothetical protein
MINLIKKLPAPRVKENRALYKRVNDAIDRVNKLILTTNFVCGEYEKEL